MFLLAGRKSDQASPGTAPADFQTTLNWPSALHLADVDRLGDVMIRQHLGDSAGEVRRLETRKRREHLSTSVDLAFSTAFTQRLKPM